jgi:hypothetical protein
MIVTRTGVAAFTVEFESEEELREEQRTNLSVGGLRLITSETVAPQTAVTIALRGPSGAEATVKATVVAQLPGAIALVIDGDANAIVNQLLAKQTETSWDRVRSLSQTEKLLMAVKADRSERAVLIQDNDPRVLLSVLRNPRLTVDEVVRIAKSSFINFNIIDVIMKTAQWMANLDVRLALIHNPKTPQQFGLRILPTLPDSEVRAIARAGTSMALKQAALRRTQGKP